jgi:hypothetical protein
MWLFNSQLPRASHPDKYAGAALFRVSAPAKQKCTRVLTHCARGNFSTRLKLMADWNDGLSLQILWKQSTNERGVGDTADGKNVSAGPHVRAMLPRHLVHFVKRATHHHFKLRVHFAF